jgi:aminoglycoside phosphotransferase (APT) family kinase protein
VPDRSPLALAALACAAVRGLEPWSARGQESPVEDVDVAVVDDDLHRRWVVRAPRTTAAGARLDQETRLLAGLTGWLPFAVPEVAGTAALPEGGRAVVHRVLPGVALRGGQLASSPALAGALGRALAAIHDLPARVVEDAGRPAYGPEEYRHRRLAELDRAAGTGKVPSALLARWERALEEAGAWRFTPVPVHGDLSAQDVLVDGNDVVAMVQWAEARVADPADDLAWVAVGADSHALPGLVAAYTESRREKPDRDLQRRARLAGELAVARWLLHGVSTEDGAVVDDAVGMLTSLEASVGDTPW